MNTDRWRNNKKLKNSKSSVEIGFNLKGCQDFLCDLFVSAYI